MSKGNPNPSPETRFGASRGNPINRSTGAWKKEETARFKFESIVNMSPEQLKEKSAEPGLSLLERNIIKAVINLNNKTDLTIADISELIDVYESKPMQRVEMSEMPTPEPLVKPKGSRNHGVHGDDDTQATA